MIAWIIGLLLAGLVLVFFELLTTSLVFATMALTAFAAAVYLSFTVSSGIGVAMVLAVLIGVPLYLMALVRLLPRMRVGRSLFLGKLPSATAEGTPEIGKYQQLIGKIGVAETLLRPSGAVRVEGLRVQAQSESGVIERGQKVKIVGANMANVIVRPEIPENG